MSSLYYVGLCFCRSIYINLRQFCSGTIYMAVHKLLNLQQYTTFKKCIAKISSFTHTLNTQHRLGFEEIAVSNQITKQNPSKTQETRGCRLLPLESLLQTAPSLSQWCQGYPILLKVYIQLTSIFTQLPRNQYLCTQSSTISRVNRCRVKQSTTEANGSHKL